MIMKRIFTLLSTMFVLCALSAQTTWTSYAADEFAGGSGTSSDPYLIETAAQLAKIAKDCDEGNDFDEVYFRLENDIDLSGVYWEPIGGSSSFDETTFWGIIDGNGHSISNMNVYKSTYSSGLTSDADFVAGFVSQLGGYGEIRNLTIASGSVFGRYVAGAFAAMCEGLIYNCTNYATVSSTMGYVGGIAGALWPTLLSGTGYGAIMNCVNYGDVSATGSNGYNAGGIVGDLQGTVQRCANFGDVMAYSSVAAGIAAYISRQSYVYDCYNRGDVTVGYQHAGGIAGLVPNVSLTVENCYNAASVETTSSDYNNWASVGAIVGYLQYTSGYVTMDRVYINTDYNTNQYSGISYIGTTSANVNIGSSCAEITSTTMQTETFLAMLNSRENDNVWSADQDNINNGFPVLTFQVYPIIDESDPDPDPDPEPEPDPEDPEPDSGITGFDATSGKVYGANNSILFEGEGNPQVKVWSVSGAMLFDGNAGTLAGKHFDSGLYVVTVDGQAQKVLVK